MNSVNPSAGESEKKEKGVENEKNGFDYIQDKFTNANLNFAPLCSLYKATVFGYVKPFVHNKTKAANCCKRKRN